MRFDTRNQKPKIWNIAILSAVTLVLCLAVLLFGGTSRHLALVLLLDVYLLAVTILLVIAFYRQLQYNPYSYNTIYYIGFALFVFSIFLTILTMTVMMFRYEGYEGNGGLNTILGLLESSGHNYMIYSFPFIALFSLALCISNISLIMHEGFRVVNVLGIVLSILLVGGEIFVFQINYYASGSMIEVMVHDLVTGLFATVYLYYECMLIGSIIANIIVTRYEPDPVQDFVIILGCAIRRDGTPTPLLRSRIDRALAFARKQKEKTGKDITFVTSGGQGPNEVVSESACMKRYLMERGIPQERIIEEDQSTDTLENMKFSKEKIMARNPEAKVIFSTNGYHVFRSGIWARRVKMRAIGISAKTKWYFWPNAAVREFIGLLTEHRVKQIVIFASMILVHVVLTILYYQI